MNLIALAVPAFLVLVVIDVLVGHWRGQKFYRLNDSITDLSCGILQRLFASFVWRGFPIAVYILIYDTYHLFEIGSSWQAWVICFLAVDLDYYWYHRGNHRIGYMWASHVVHHQSEEFNLVVGLRPSPLSILVGIPFRIPLALIGVPPAMLVTLGSIVTVYQFWIHTRTIGDLGPLEWFLNTPSHHRVHHGSNPQYRDKNYGGTLVIWDRLFGTFQKEEEEVIYGLAKPFRSWNPIWANLYYWSELIASARSMSSLWHKLLVFVKPPGWRPGAPAGHEPALASGPSGAERRTKFDVRYPNGIGAYALVQFVPTLLAGVSLGHFAPVLGSTVTAVGIAVVLWSISDLGGLLEGRRWAYHAEIVRLAVLPLLALLYVHLEPAAPWWLPGPVLLNTLFIPLLHRARSASPNPSAEPSQLLEVSPT